MQKSLKIWPWNSSMHKVLLHLQTDIDISSETKSLSSSCMWNLLPSCYWKPLLRARCGCKDGSSLVGCLGVNRLPLNTRKRCVFSNFSTDNQKHCNIPCSAGHLSPDFVPQKFSFSAGNMPLAFKHLLLWVLSLYLGLLTFLSGNPERLCRGTHFLILSQIPNLFPLLSSLLFA